MSSERKARPEKDTSSGRVKDWLDRNADKIFKVLLFGIIVVWVSVAALIYPHDRNHHVPVKCTVTESKTLPGDRRSSPSVKVETSDCGDLKLFRGMERKADRESTVKKFTPGSTFIFMVGEREWKYLPWGQHRIYSYERVGK